MTHLTIEDKIQLLSGDGMWHTKSCNGKIPAIMMTDGPHGLRKQDTSLPMQNNISKKSVCYPTESVVACSWDENVAAKMAVAIAQDALSEQVSIVLGCGVNIKRSPLCGRNFEYFSEDPYLAGTLATAYIKSMESMGVATSLKHFAGNSQETRRQTSNSQIDTRALYEIYLSAFEMAVKKGKPSTIMASYNRLNGVYACENVELLTNILKKKWGYDGLVISDWGACANLRKCIQAGMHLEMPDSLGIHAKQLNDDLNEGRISKKEITAAAKKILELVERQSSRLKKCTVDQEKQHQIACEIECESAVLLKNEGLLPLTKEQKILVIGEMAQHMRYQGGGSSHINVTKEPDAVKALNNAGLKITYCQGYRSSFDTIDATSEEQALTGCEQYDVILFFGGLTENYEGEGYDRKTLEIPYNQRHLLHLVHEKNPNIVFVAFGGSVMDFAFERDVKSILHMYLGGQAVDEALTKLLLGEVNPSGKLAESYPMKLTDVPSYLYFGLDSDDVEYRESLFVGYRYYTTYQVPVRYCFGYGLSYTTFEYSDMKLSSKEYLLGGDYYVTCMVTNTGAYEGKEVVQVYVKNPACNYLRPTMELRGFQKVSLKPGESKCVSIALTERSFSVYDEEKETFLVPAGIYTIMIGSSSEDIRLQEEVNVTGIPYERDDRKLYPEYFTKVTDGFHISKAQFQKLYQLPLSHFDEQKPGDFSTYNSLNQLSRYSFLARLTLWYAKRMIHKMYPSKSKDDPEVMMTLQGVQEGTIDCVICQSGGVPYKLAEAIVLSANGEKLKALKKLL